MPLIVSTFSFNFTNLMHWSMQHIGLALAHLGEMQYIITYHFLGIYIHNLSLIQVPCTQQKMKLPFQSTSFLKTPDFPKHRATESKEINNKNYEPIQSVHLF